MEWFLYYFCEIFTHLTSFLIVWGMMACYILFKTTTQAYNNRRLVRKMDVLYMIGLTISTATLISILLTACSEGIVENGYKIKTVNIEWNNYEVNVYFINLFI